MRNSEKVYLVVKEDGDKKTDHGVIYRGQVTSVQVNNNNRIFELPNAVANFYATDDRTGSKLGKMEIGDNFGI